MRIAILGAGRVGTALGARWQAAGHDVVYGVRDPADPRHADLVTDSPAGAVEGADAVLVALPWASVEAVVTTLDLSGRVVIDATNPLAAGARELDSHPELSGGQLIERWAPGARVVKAFNTTGSGNMADPTYGAGAPVMLVAGDDEDAKHAAMDLATDVGFDAADAGPLAAARDLEHLAALWIRLAYGLGNGPDIAFVLARR